MALTSPGSPALTAPSRSPAGAVQGFWDPRACEAGAIFAAVRDAAAPFTGLDDWPDLELLCGEARARRLCNAAGLALRFAPATPKKRRRGRPAVKGPSYETLVFETGCVPTRARSWHDYFNFLMWCSFPATKAALNARQVAAARESSDPAVQAWRRRTSEQNRLTMLDEGGVIVATSPHRFDATVDWLRSLNGQRLLPFRDAARLADLEADVWTFGHALLEAAHDGDWDMTALALVVAVPDGERSGPVALRRNAADREAARLIADERALAAPTSLPGFSIASLRHR